METALLGLAAAQTHHVHARVGLGVVFVSLGDGILDLEAESLEPPAQHLCCVAVGVTRRIDARNPDQLRREIDDLLPRSLDLAAYRLSSVQMRQRPKRYRTPIWISRPGK